MCLSMHELSVQETELLPDREALQALSWDTVVHATTVAVSVPCAHSVLFQGGPKPVTVR
jgi:hypothetical protein